MRDNLLVFVLATAVIVLGAGVAFISKPIEQPPLDTRVRLLNCDADFYKDRLVRLPSEGMLVSDSKTLVYKPTGNEPSIVVCRFNQPLPDKLPKYIIGTCIGRKGSAVEVINCTLSDKD